MPKLLPGSFIPEKNKLASANATVLLCEISNPDFDTVYLARNTENITSNGQPYTALWFEIDAVKESSKGDIPTITLRVNNPARALEPTLEAYGGAVDANVKIMAVNVANPNDTLLEMNFDVMSSSSDDHWVYLSLGAPSLLRKRFPPQSVPGRLLRLDPGRRRVHEVRGRRRLQAYLCRLPGYLQ